MSNKVVDIKTKSQIERPAHSDFWFAAVDVRLSRIEIMVTRLEWQIWLLVCGAAALVILAIVDVMKAG